MPPTLTAAPSDPTILDTQETAGQTPAAANLGGPRDRHACWEPARNRIFAAMQAANIGWSRLKRFADCGARRLVLVRYDDRDTPTFRKVTVVCKDRLCTPCANMRADQIRRNLYPHLPTRRWLFLTLTIRSTTDPLRTQLANLHRYFRQLRRRPEWSDWIQDGLATVEVTLNATNGLWHPHLHVIAASPWIPIAPLRDAWTQITAGSRFIHVEKIREHRLVANYVTKYVTKPVTYKVTHDPQRLQEAIRALKGSRLLVTFGAATKWHLTATNADAGWQIYCTEGMLRDKAWNGSSWWRALLDAFQNADPDTGLMVTPFDIPP